MISPFEAVYVLPFDQDESWIEKETYSKQNYT